MIKKIKTLINKETGSTFILFSFLLIGLLGIVGLVLDGGTLLVTKVHLQKTANAAVLSGAQELLNQEQSVTDVVNHILSAHDEQNSLNKLTVAMEHKLSIDLKKEVPFPFLQLFGFENADVTAQAAAGLASMNGGRGAAPLGIDESIPLEFNTPYKLKVDQTEVSAGNFGILALEGPGAKTYEENLRTGYSGELNIGDIIETQTGNIAGKTITVINERINACPYPSGDFSHGDCPRIILIPIYQPYNFVSNQLKAVKITGFAYFYILEPMDSQDTSITGMFIKKIGTGYGDENTINKGAYVIKLTK